MDAEPQGGFEIRPATAGDVPAIHGMILELAVYEKLSDRVTAVEDDVRRTLFGEHPAAEVLLARVGDRPVGFALFFHNYSTFLGRRGLYLEDLFVKPAHRGRGIGKALLARLAAIARARGCGRMEWAVLDWNRPAIDFYRSLGAEPLDEWTVFRLAGEKLDALAGPNG